LQKTSLINYVYEEQSSHSIPKMLTILKQKPFHVALLALCSYPMIMVATGKYDGIDDGKSKKKTKTKEPDK